MWDDQKDKKEENKSEGLWTKKDKPEKDGLWGKETERERNPGTGIWDKRIHLPEQFSGEFSSMMYGNYHAGSAYDSQLPGEFNGPPAEQQSATQSQQTNQQASTSKEKPKEKEGKVGFIESVLAEEAKPLVLEGAGKSEQRYNYGSPYLAGGLKRERVEGETEEKPEEETSTGAVKDRWGKLPITQADVERILKMLREFSLKKERELSAKEVNSKKMGKKEIALWALGFLLLLFAIIWAVFFVE